MCVLYTRLDHHPLFSHYAKLCEANQPIEWKSDKIGIKLIVRVASMTPTLLSPYQCQPHFIHGLLDAHLHEASMASPGPWWDYFNLAWIKDVWEWIRICRLARLDSPDVRWVSWSGGAGNSLPLCVECSCSYTCRADRRCGNGPLSEMIFGEMYFHISVGMFEINHPR